MNEVDKARLKVMDEVIELFDDFGTGGDDDWAYQKNAIEMLEVHKEKMVEEINAREASLFEWGIEEVAFSPHSGRKKLRIECKLEGKTVAKGVYLADIWDAKYNVWVTNTNLTKKFDTLDEAKAWVEGWVRGGGK